MIRHFISQPVLTLINMFVSQRISYDEMIRRLQSLTENPPNNERGRDMFDDALDALKMFRWLRRADAIHVFSRIVRQNHVPFAP